VFSFFKIFNLIHINSILPYKDTPAGKKFAGFILIIFHQVFDFSGSGYDVLVIPPNLFGKILL